MFSKLYSMWQDQAMQPKDNSAAHFIASTLIAKTLCGRKVRGGGP